MKSGNQFGEIIPNCALVVELDDLSIDSIHNIDHLRQGESLILLIEQFPKSFFDNTTPEC